MFQPKYTITPKLLNNIKRITVLITDLNNRRYSKVVLTEMIKAALIISSHASTSIEGNPLPLTEVKKILKNQPANLRQSEIEVINYNQALKDLNKLIQKKTPKLSLSLILAIQEKVIKGLVENFRCGFLRNEPVFVNNPKTGKTIYLPPDHQDVRRLVNELIDYLNRNQKIIDPLILAGLFHKQFVIIHPFMDGNGRTARLITKFLLASLGVDTFNLFSFENYYNQDVSLYFQKVGVLGNYYEIRDNIDFTDWLEYFTDGIIDELLRVSKELEKAVLTPEVILNDDQQKLLDYLKEKGCITNRGYAQMTKRAKATRNLDFNKLIKLGLIERKRKGKAAYYQLKN